MKTAVLYLLYSLVVLAGGIAGFKRANSKPSLISALIATFVIDLGVVHLFIHKYAMGNGLVAFAALALTVFFIVRFARTKNPMPAVPVIAISIVILLIAVDKLLHH